MIRGRPANVGVGAAPRERIAAGARSRTRVRRTVAAGALVAAAAVAALVGSMVVAGGPGHPPVVLDATPTRSATEDLGEAATADVDRAELVGGFLGCPGPAILTELTGPAGIRGDPSPIEVAERHARANAGNLSGVPETHTLRLLTRSSSLAHVLVVDADGLPSVLLGIERRDESHGWLVASHIACQPEDRARPALGTCEERDGVRA